jgi:hypothetical protein
MNKNAKPLIASPISEIRNSGFELNENKASNACATFFFSV